MSYNIEGKYILEGKEKEYFETLDLVKFLELLNKLESEGLYFLMDVNIQHHVD